MTAKDKLEIMINGPVAADMSKLILHIKISDLPSTLAIDFYITCLSELESWDGLKTQIDTWSEEKCSSRIELVSSMFESACTGLSNQVASLGGRHDRHDDNIVGFWMKGGRSGSTKTSPFAQTWLRKK